MTWNRGGNKYGAKKKEVDGIRFDSIKEADYYVQLKLRLAGGHIASFERQVPFVLQEKFSDQYGACREIKYVADFTVIHSDGSMEIVDVKGFETAIFKLKWKMLRKLVQEKEYLLSIV